MINSWASDQVSGKHESIYPTVVIIALERDLGDAKIQLLARKIIGKRNYFIMWLHVKFIGIIG